MLGCAPKQAKVVRLDVVFHHNVRLQEAHAIVGHFQHKTAVDDAVGAGQVAVRFDWRLVQMRHSLQGQAFL